MPIGEIIKILKRGGVGVLPTDTLYGLVGSALNEKAVQKIYRLKQRSENKPFIILIADLKDLKLFSCLVGQKEKIVFKKYWPGKISIILECPSLAKEMSYLKPLNKALAFRLPKPKWLRDLIKQTGPIVAPSANPEEEKPAETIKEAKNYFGNNVDFYVDKGRLKGLPSTLIGIQDDKVIIRRQGAIKI